VQENGRTVILETQRVGTKVYKMKAIPGQSTGGTMAGTLKFPLFVDRWQSSREFTPRGTVTHVTTVYGSDTPIVGWLWNWY